MMMRAAVTAGRLEFRYLYYALQMNILMYWVGRARAGADVCGNMNAFDTKSKAFNSSRFNSSIQDQEACCRLRCASAYTITINRLLSIQFKFRSHIREYNIMYIYNFIRSKSWVEIKQIKYHVRSVLLVVRVVSGSESVCIADAGWLHSLNS